MNFQGMKIQLFDIWCTDLTLNALSCHSTKRRKEYLVLTCGPPSLSFITPNGKGEDGESCSDEDNSGDEENQTVSFFPLSS